MNSKRRGDKWEGIDRFKIIQTIVALQQKKMDRGGLKL